MRPFHRGSLPPWVQQRQESGSVSIIISLTITLIFGLIIVGSGGRLMDSVQYLAVKKSHGIAKNASISAIAVVDQLFNSGVF